MNQLESETNTTFAWLPSRAVLVIGMATLSLVGFEVSANANLPPVPFVDNADVNYIDGTCSEPLALPNGVFWDLLLCAVDKEIRNGLIWDWWSVTCVGLDNICVATDHGDSMNLYALQNTFTPPGIPDVEKNLGEQCPLAGNPINVAVGNKFQVETDYAGTGTGYLPFRRYYNSQRAQYTQNWSSVGHRWRHSYSSSLSERAANSPNKHRIVATRADGRKLRFRPAGGGWVPFDQDVTDALTELPAGGFDYRVDDGSVEHYDSSGRLVSLTSREGFTTTLVYDVESVDGGDSNPETLDRVVSPFCDDPYATSLQCRHLEFSYTTLQGANQTVEGIASLRIMPAGDE